MSKEYLNIYFTQQDPDYRPKGSRDPLGFQVIWQAVGGRIIPYLSTVSSNLRDFQIMSLAYYYYGDKIDDNFYSFFMKFEQLAAYVRKYYLAESGFNGTNSTTNRLRETPNKLRIGTAKTDQILISQMAYGIWGKYNRPFTDLKIRLQTDFKLIYNEKCAKLKKRNEIDRWISKLRHETSFKVDIKDLACFKELFIITGKEKTFYKKLILHTIEKGKGFQDALYSFLEADSKLPEKFELYPFLKAWSKKTKDKALLKILMDIEAVDNLLAIYDRTFRYLQSGTTWKKDEIIKDKKINNWKKIAFYDYTSIPVFGLDLSKMYSILKSDNWIFAQKMLDMNKTITDKRRGMAWITKDGTDKLKVNYSEGADRNGEFMPGTNSYSGYFIPTYLGLYRQISNN